MRKILKFLLLLLILVTSLWSCSEDEVKICTIKVASEMRIMNVHPRGGFYLESCIMGKSKDLFNNDEWYPFPGNGIAGFEFVEGYECILLVKVYVDKSTQDSGPEYKLYKVISKEKKNSEGLPENESEEGYHKK